MLSIFANSGATVTVEKSFDQAGTKLSTKSGIELTALSRTNASIVRSAAT